MGLFDIIQSKHEASLAQLNAEKDAYNNDARLRGRLSDLQPYYTINGQKPQTFIDSVQPARTNEFGMVQSQPSPFQKQLPTSQDRAEIIADEAMRRGDIGTAVNAINMVDALNKRAAMDKSFGGSQQYQQLMGELDMIGKVGVALQQVYKSSGGGVNGRSMVRQFIARNPSIEQFVGNLDTLEMTDKYVAQELQGAPGYKIFVDQEGKPHLIEPKKEEETWGDPYETTVGGKRAMVQKSSRGQVKPIVQDTSTTVKVNTSGGRSVGGGYGKPPIGYRYTLSGDLEPIPGGPADQKITAASKAQEGAVAAIDTAINSVNDLLAHPGRSSATGKSSITNILAIPGGDAKTFLHKLDTFKSQMFVPMVQQLKGMGQLSDAEGKKLTAAVGALEPTMSESEFKSSLETILAELQATRERASRPISSATTGKESVRDSANRPKGNTPKPAHGKGGKSISSFWK